ncbi:hypothetical protein [Clostridium sp.]|uniref:hypothetical protein n=1 Tax=Clostridium sp. TaxID=1506 RepID=UPI0034647D77
MKKKVAILILVTMLSTSLFACSNKDKNSTSTNNTSSTEESSKTSSETKSEESTEKSNEKSANSTKSESAKESSIQSPLQIGETGITSKYSVKSKDERKANVTLTNIIRGEAAQKLVDEFNAENGFISISPLESSLLEFAVAEYTTTLPNDFPADDESAIDQNLRVDITGLDGEGLKYDGILYIPSAWNFNSLKMSDVFLKSGESAKARVVFAMPKGCTDYLINFGEYDNTLAYYRGK